MAIVEDEVRNDSSEENEIEVVVEEYDAEQDSEDSDAKMRESKRKCFKCGASPADSGVALYRFPLPGLKNALRCELWAKYVSPDKEWWSPEFQKKLYSEHRMLCSKHFDEKCFVDPNHKKLGRHTVPVEKRDEAGHSHSIGATAPGISNTELPEVSPVTDVIQEWTLVDPIFVTTIPGSADPLAITITDTNLEVVYISEVVQDDDDIVDEALERKVAEIEERIKDDPYNYDDHIELIQALWGLSELERWRAAFDRLQQMTALKPDHWLMRLQTEATLSHSTAKENRDEIAYLFRQATLDCYSIQILSEWCSWSLSGSEPEYTRSQIDEVLHRAGADPLSGKVFWDAKLEFEKAQADSMSQEDEKYKEQRERILFCLEEMVSRPLLRAEEAWEPLLELAQVIHGQDYVNKVTKQHNAAMDYLQKITPFEDKLLTLENTDEKFKVYLDYIETVKELSREDKYKECDSDGILKVLYERASTECGGCAGAQALLVMFARFVRSRSSRASYWRALHACTRRAPQGHIFWTMQMQQLEHEGNDENVSGQTVKSIFETALAKGMDSFKQTEALWLSYVEYARRKTDFDDEKQIELLRNTFRLAWDSLADVWGEEANDCEIPLFWARLEYQRMKDPKQGKDIFEEIFKYGENKTMSKYWEALIHLEMGRSPPISEHKLRDLFRRALRSVTDYPPAVARMWMDYERDYGHLDTLRECTETCEAKLKEWRDNYQVLKDKMTGKKQKPNKPNEKKSKFDKKKKIEEKPKTKGKRKSEETAKSQDVKRKRDESEAELQKEKDGDSKGVKRSHDSDNDSDNDKETKRQRRDSTEDTRPAARDACTLFVSNLEFKVNEQNLRDKLSEYGDIVSLRVKSGVKAFGGSICYCQYKNKEAVDKALKFDRTPLDGRPMFLSRYSAKKTKPQFKYATSTEKNKLFVRNLPYEHCTKEALAEIFDKFGKLKDVRVVTFKDGKPKGLAYVDYEDEESAARAIEKTNGMVLCERKIDVAVSAPPPRAEPPATLGLHKRDGSGGMRRTQLSTFLPSVLQKTSFVPSVLQKASTSKVLAANGNHKDELAPSQGNGDQTSEEKRPMSNKDFRSMLLGQK